MRTVYLAATLAALGLAGCATTGATAPEAASASADGRIAVPTVDAAPELKVTLEPAPPADPAAASIATDTIPVEVEYQFLRLTQIMAERMDKAHLDEVSGYGSPIPEGKVDLETLAAAIDVTADQTALIAAPEDVVAGGAYLLQTGVEQRAWIDNRVRNLLVAQPGLATYDLSLMEEAVLVRWGVLDGLQSIKQREGGGNIDDVISRFQDDTLRLHDDFQFAAFEQDLDSLSEDALEDLDATLKAFTLNTQRDLDDNSALAAVRRYEDLTNAAKREANLRLQRRLAQAALLALVIFAN